jgi:hypothetical protein
VIVTVTLIKHHVTLDEFALGLPYHRVNNILEMVVQLCVKRNIKDYLGLVTMVTLRVVMAATQDNHVNTLGMELDKHSKYAISAVYVNSN